MRRRHCCCESRFVVESASVRPSAPLARPVHQLEAALSRIFSSGIQNDPVFPPLSLSLFLSRHPFYSARVILSSSQTDMMCGAHHSSFQTSSPTKMSLCYFFSTSLPPFHIVFLLHCTAMRPINNTIAYVHHVFHQFVSCECRVYPAWCALRRVAWRRRGPKARELLAPDHLLHEQR